MLKSNLKFFSKYIERKTINGLSPYYKLGNENFNIVKVFGVPEVWDERELFKYFDP